MHLNVYLLSIMSTLEKMILYLIYIYNNKWSCDILKLNSKLEFQFCTMCPKLFILKEFYFLILKSNVEAHHKYLSKWVIKYKK